MRSSGVAGRYRSAILAIIGALALAACHPGEPKACRKEPKGFECRDYHRRMAYVKRAEREKEALRAGPQKVKKGTASKFDKATVKVRRNTDDAG